jgi:hypothetical protein
MGQNFFERKFLLLQWFWVWYFNRISANLIFIGTLCNHLFLLDRLINLLFFLLNMLVNLLFINSLGNFLGLQCYWLTGLLCWCLPFSLNSLCFCNSLWLTVFRLYKHCFFSFLFRTLCIIYLFGFSFNCIQNILIFIFL